MPVTYFNNMVLWPSFIVFSCVWIRHANSSDRLCSLWRWRTHWRRWQWVWCFVCDGHAAELYGIRLQGGMVHRTIWKGRKWWILVIMVQCGAVIMQSNFSQIFTKTPHSSPVRARYGVTFVDPAFDWYSASVPVNIYVISYNIQPHFNDTQLYFFQEDTLHFVDWINFDTMKVRMSQESSVILVCIHVLPHLIIFSFTLLVFSAVWWRPKETWSALFFWQRPGEHQQLWPSTATRCIRGL